MSIVSQFNYKKLQKCMFKMTNELKNKICDFIDYCLKNDFIHTRENVNEKQYLCEQLFMYCCCDIMQSSRQILINEQSYDFKFEILNENLFMNNDNIIESLCIVFYFDTIEHNSKRNYKFIHIVDICDDNEIFDNEFSKQQLFNTLN